MRPGLPTILLSGSLLCIAVRDTMSTRAARPDAVAAAQATTVVFETEIELGIDGTGQSVGNALIELDGGGFAIVGYTDAEGAGGRDVVLARLDADGVVDWVKTYGGPGDDWGWDLIAVPAAERPSFEPPSPGLSTEESWGPGFWIVGFSSLGPGEPHDVLLLRTDRDGGVVSEHRFGGEGNDRAWALAPTSDGGLVIAAETTSFGAGEEDAYLIRVDIDGDLVWAVTTGTSRQDRVFSVAEVPGTGFVFTGITRGPDTDDAGERDAYVVMVDDAGEVLWEHTFGGAQDDVGHGIRAAADGTIIVTGYGRSFGDGSNDLYLVGLSATGEQLWRAAHDTDGADDRAMMSAEVHAEGRVTIGYSDASGDHDARLTATGPQGELGWAWSYANPGPDRGVMVTVASDGDYVFTGTFYRPAPAGAAAPGDPVGAGSASRGGTGPGSGIRVVKARPLGS